MHTVVHELTQLFQRLRTSDRAATRPSQRLANAVLLSTRSLLEDSKAELGSTPAQKPPPLPARPSPAQETPPTHPAEDANVASDPAPTTEEHERSSRASSSTLIDLTDDPPPPYEESKALSDTSRDKGSSQVDSDIDEKTTRNDIPDEEKAEKETIEGANDKTHDTDVSMVNAVEEDREVDRKVLRALEHQKRSSGTEQQDVEEVIGSIISLLQAAIRPSHVDEATGIQWEKIIETFFVTTVNYTKKFDEKEYQHEISYDRSITAFPALDGERSLYDALGRNFDQQVLEESRLSRYTAIKSLPPILHVLIQRTQSTGRKNDNPVVIPDTLYLDRYMDASHDSPEFRRRMEDWVTASRLNDARLHSVDARACTELAGVIEKIGKAHKPSADDDAMEVDTQQGPDASQEEDWSFDGPIEDEFLVIPREHSEQAAKDEKELSVPEGIAEAEDTVQKMMWQEIFERERVLEDHNDNSREHAYSLEAVICHRGVLNAGHYWVWIHDFEADVWRCYNDASVRVEPDTEKVLKELSSGEPYYLCYVRDKDKEDWVSVPKRESQ